MFFLLWKETALPIENERLEIARYKEEIKTLKAQLESRQEKLDAQRTVFSARQTKRLTRFWRKQKNMLTRP